MILEVLRAQLLTALLMGDTPPGARCPLRMPLCLAGEQDPAPLKFGLQPLRILCP